jgi:hypothetical protein
VAPEPPRRSRRITAGYRAAPSAEADAEEPALEGVTPSVDWLDDDPESYSAPV